MDGVEYFKHFETPESRFSERDNPNLVEISSDLAYKLRALYFVGDVALLGSQETQLANHATQTVSSHRQLRNLMGAIDLTYKPNDDMADLSDSGEQDVVRMIKSERDTLSGRFAVHNDLLLSRVISKIHNAGPTPNKNSTPQTIVKNELRSQNKELAKLLWGWQSTVRANYDSNDSGTYKDFSLEIDRSHGFHVPEWVLEAKDPDGPAQILCSIINELETLLVLNEWVVAKGLPYLPIIAPIHYEASITESAKNPHADILLCCLEPGVNDVVPIQVKKRVVEMTRERYIDGMVFITPQDFGQTNVSHLPIREKGVVRTGNRVTYTYGEILSDFVTANSMRKGYKPTKQQKKRQSDRIDLALAGIDRIMTREGLFTSPS